TPPDSQLTSLAQSSLNNEIHCYSLPYGALGFTSHILTYYTILCFWFGRKPLWPFSRIRYSQFDLVLGIVGLGVTTAVSIVTILRCRNTWQLLVIAVWKLDMSLLNGITAVHVAVLMRRRVMGGGSGEVVGGEAGRPTSFFDGKDEKETVVGVTPVQDAPSRGLEEQQEPIHVLPLKSASWWILLYIPGMLAGIIGLMSLIHKFGHGHHGITKLTASFYTIVGVGIITYLLGSIYTLFHLGSPGIVYRIAVGGLVWGLAAFGILAVFYSDWALGMMAGNISGLPSGDVAALYWSYFVGKRLPMLSL
ncbi:hypothetical protein K443DRAFT_102558, partial [Laccaria amethystina LaAM-08-1]